jgi:hypothetical protein
MSGSNKAKARGKGKPFQKGDSRINRDHGPRCADAAAYSMNATNALAKALKPEEWAGIVAKKARAGIPWAIQLYADLLIEKQAQQHDVNLRGEVLFIMPRPK